MDLLGLISGTDNIFKYLLSGGIVLITLSILYPMRMANELELEVNSYNERADLLNHRITETLNEAKRLQEKVNEVNSRISDTTVYNHSDSVNAKRSLDDFESIKAEVKEIESTQIELKYLRNRASILQNQFKEFNYYKWWLLISGALLGLAGLIGWGILTYQGLRKNSNPQHPPRSH